MNKDELKQHIKLCQDSEAWIADSIAKYDINLREGNRFYIELNYIIHKLRVSIFGEKKTDILESYIYDENPPCKDIESLWDLLK